MLIKFFELSTQTWYNTNSEEHAQRNATQATLKSEYNSENLATLPSLSLSQLSLMMLSIILCAIKMELKYFVQ